MSQLNLLLLLLLLFKCQARVDYCKISVRAVDNNVIFTVNKNSYVEKGGLIRFIDRFFACFSSKF